MDERKHGKNLKMLKEFKERKILKQQKAEENDWGPPKPFDMSFLENLKVNFTQEENYEAYKLFCIMDVDNSGLVSLRELERVLMGDTLRTIIVEFDHPDSGIIWNLDADECVAIQRIETASPASRKSELINGLRLLRVNQTPIQLYQSRSLEVLHKELIKVHDDYVDYEFIEPLVDGRDFHVKLPIGAVNNLQHFEEEIHVALKKCHPSLGLIDVHIDSKSRQVTFSCDRFPFRLMFKTGKYFQTSCRYALGFSAVDSPTAHEHKGQALSIDLNLGLTQVEMEILMNELFSRFDTDGSGEFQFEEFRDFYIRFLATPESIDLLRRFAAHRFRDIEVEKRRNKILEERRKKAARRKYLREKNKDLVVTQVKKRKENSAMSEDGMIRRVYKAKREDQIQIRVKKNRGQGPGASLPAVEEEAPKEEEDEEELERKAVIDREKVKAKQREQDIRRKKKLNELLDIGAQQEKDLKRLQREATNREARLHMAEIGQILQKSFQHAFRVGATGIEGMNTLTLTQNRVLTPALKITPEMFRDGAQVEDINLEDLGPELMHPAAKRYFFARAVKSEEFDVRKRHPAFFGCDYRREGSRHSSLALGAVRSIVASRAVLDTVAETESVTTSNNRKAEMSMIELTRRDLAGELVQQCIHNEFKKIVFRRARDLVRIDVINETSTMLLHDAVSKYEQNEVKKRISDEFAKKIVAEACEKIIEAWYESGGSIGNIAYKTPSSASSAVGSGVSSPVRRMSGLDGMLFTGGPMMNLEDLRVPIQSTDFLIRPKTASSVGSNRSATIGDGGLASRRQSRVDIPDAIPERITAGMVVPGLARLASHSSCEESDDDKSVSSSDNSSPRDNGARSKCWDEESGGMSSAVTLELPSLSDDERNRMVALELQNRLNVRTLARQLSSSISEITPTHSTADVVLKRFCYMYSLAVIGVSCDRVTDAMFTIASTECSQRIDDDTLDEKKSDDKSNSNSDDDTNRSTDEGYIFDTTSRPISVPGTRGGRRGAQVLKTPQTGPAVTRSDSVEAPPDYYPQPNQMLLSISMITIDGVFGVDTVMRALKPVMKGRLSTGSWQATSFVAEVSKGGSYSTEYSILFSEFNFISVWNKFCMRFTQSLQLRCIDAVTRLQLGTIDVPYVDIDNATDRTRGHEVQCVKIASVMHCMPQFNSGKDVNVTITLKVHIEGADYAVPNRPVSYFDQRRSQHWATYPITPINAGVVRQRFKDVAIAYDRQMIINPCFYGFSVRWKGGRENESMFVHPMFSGFTLSRKPLSKQMMEDLHLQAQKKAKPNPWKFKPGGVCPICYDGQPGCPRCWALPLKPNGDPSRLEDFAFDPEREAAAIAARNNKIMKRQEALELKESTKKFLEQVGALRSMREDDVKSESSSSSSDSESTVQLNSVADDESVQLHTKLTTEDGIRLYRTLILENVNVYVKVMPGHHIRQLVADPRDSVLHLHNMFKTHSDTGNSKGSMLILPTVVGFYEMDADVIPANEFLLGRNTGSIPLSKYGFKKRGSTVCLLYFPKYLPHSTSALLMAFFKENMDIVLPPRIPTISHNKGVPDEIEKDIIQENLVKILRRQYFDQQIQERVDMAARAREQKIKKQLEENARMERIRQQKIEDDKRRIAEEKRLAAQLKGLSAEEREKEMIRIFENEMAEKIRTGTKDEIAALEKVQKAALRMAAMESRKERKELRSLSRSQTVQSTATSEDDMRPMSRDAGAASAIGSSLASLTIKEEDAIEGDEEEVLVEKTEICLNSEDNAPEDSDGRQDNVVPISRAASISSEKSNFHNNVIELQDARSVRSEQSSASGGDHSSRRSSGIISELTAEQSMTSKPKHRKKSRSDQRLKTSQSAPALTEVPNEDVVSTKSPATATNLSHNNNGTKSSACIIQ